MIRLLKFHSQELKRDLCKLMRVDKAYSEVKKKPKSMFVIFLFSMDGVLGSESLYKYLNVKVT